ncbi:glutamate-5-semialdehyde dehydrogenase [Methanomassiliicoccus luminyensis]|uniref:glutamate-5-semialdehyde dehydrogenase n=1 Tax=Methanomassiliicoccus luminyensis TaxID=1080712 RepID=UPI00037FFFAD|nr:glutamate-5-semialdehyde dehydrogenase [Methanomassiliicoccus luminyensis]
MKPVRAAAEKAREASYRLSSLPLAVRNKALESIAEALLSRQDEISRANAIDLEAAEKAKISKVLVKRLKFDGPKIEEAVRGVRALIEQEDVVGKLLSRTELDDGLVLDKVSCPIGVIGVVFESRPDALVQISCLCLKSGNAVLLKGGSEAKETNEVLARTIVDAVAGVDGRFADAVQLLSTREEFRELLKHDDLIDLIIPRGSNELVRSIKESTRIPVMGHAAGICHTYVDKDADLDMAVKVCFDAKVQYPAVCNAMETLLVHRAVAEDFLPRMAAEYGKAAVELRGDDATRKLIKAVPATEGDWSAEYNDLVLAVKIVGSLDEAIEHVNRFSSHHTDAIVTRDEGAAQRFMDLVDSSSVMWNASTRFADGYRYGLGAEVGISTNKTHARGPVGLEGLVIYKYKLRGTGQTVAEYSGKDARKFTHGKIA